MSGQTSSSALQQSGNAPTTGSVAMKPAIMPDRSEAPLLNDSGDNYNNWSCTMKLLLWICGLLSIVDGTTPTPDMMTDLTGYAEWYEKDQEALFQIIVTLKMEGQNCMHNVQHQRSVGTGLQTSTKGKATSRSSICWRSYS